MQRFTHFFGHRFARLMADLQAVGDVVKDRHVREKRVVLKHESEAAFVGGHGRDVGPVHENLTGGGRLKTRDHAQRGGLAAARGAEEGEKFAGAHLEVDVVDGEELLVVLHKAAADVFEGE